METFFISRLGMYFNTKVIVYMVKKQHRGIYLENVVLLSVEGEHAGGDEAAVAPAPDGHTLLKQCIYNVCPGSSDPPEKIFNVFASENEGYTLIRICGHTIY